MYDLRAEYGAAGPGDFRPVQVWHVVRDGEIEAICGHRLSSEAITRPIADWERVAHQHLCTPCRDAYRMALPPAG